MFTVLGVPFRLADKLGNILGLEGIRINVKEVIRNFFVKRDCTEDVSS